MARGSKEQSSVVADQSRLMNRRQFLRLLSEIGVGALSLDSTVNLLGNMLSVVDVEALHNPEPEKLASFLKQQEQELPSDVLTAEQLANEFNTRIFNLWQADFPNDYVELSLRKSVAQEPLFVRLAEDRARLSIMIVNSHTLDPDALTEEQSAYLNSSDNGAIAVLQDYAILIREENRQEIEHNRLPMLLEYNQKQAELTQRQHLMTVDQYNVEYWSLIYLYSRYFREEPTEEDLQFPHAIRGLIYTHDEGYPLYQKKPHYFVFIAVRDFRDAVTITEGDQSITIGRQLLGAPHPSQSLPSIENFRLREHIPNQEAYLVKAGNPGFIFRHEIQHPFVTTERDADLGALRGIYYASDRLLSTGSDDLYYVVFRTPEGITITRAPHNYRVV